jgi:RNA polymerase sigma-70 factor (ECF subfamily)
VHATIQPALAMTESPLDLAALVRRHQLGLWRYLRALGARGDLAEDLLQDTFLVALDRLHEDRGEAAVATFLRETARHLWLRRRRDQGRREVLLAEFVEAKWRDVAAADDGERWLEALRSCVDGLDGKARDAVQRSYRDGEDRRTIALALGMKENGVKTLLQRVRAVLRACVERRLGAGDLRRNAGEANTNPRRTT